VHDGAHRAIRQFLCRRQPSQREDILTAFVEAGTGWMSRNAVWFTTGATGVFVADAIEVDLFSMRTRDRRFDARFFVAATATGAHCRPIRAMELESTVASRCKVDCEERELRGGINNASTVRCLMNGLEDEATTAPPQAVLRLRREPLHARSWWSSASVTKISRSAFLRRALPQV
jgi:hypothetical protein